MTESELKQGILDDAYEIRRDRDNALRVMHERCDRRLVELFCESLVAAIEHRNHYFIGQADSICVDMSLHVLRERGTILSNALADALRTLP